MNTRFAVAAHILTLLHTQAGEPVTSELLASSINTNPSLVRRLLMQLGEAGLTRSQMGAGGGTLLARSANRITLLDVFRAVEHDGTVLPLHQNPNPACLVGRNIAAALDRHIGAAEKAMETALSRTTIASLTGEVLDLEKRRSAS